MNLSEEFLDVNYHESNTQYSSKPEAAYEIKEINEDLPHFITVEDDNTTMKTFMALYSAKDNKEVKSDTIFFINFQNLLHTKINILMEGKKVIE